MTKVQELVRNADGTIPDPVGFDPFDTVGIKTRYVDKAVYAHTFPLKHLLCLHESNFCATLNPDLTVNELVVTSREPWEERRFRVTMPDTVTDEFYDQLEMYERASTI
ncbi:hypothetical protein [Halorubrum lipolyticum]|uniref:Uncharacterized protein n=1 Tax=Halorubrum lipolyticum DSM 21995 TaxID=1227482 RepID=M0NI49_9EURY|nr:hypothetical protein [Halorubrum lipolyticum]EMA57248.1 hypothetical protein C469_15988 [Halorubrum lipolyticum DSM 21995]